MKKGVVLGLAVLFLLTPSVVAEGVDVYHINPPQEDFSGDKKQSSQNLVLPYEKPDPVIMSPNPTETQKSVPDSGPTPTQAQVHDPAEPVELIAEPGPLNPTIPCELQVPWKNGVPISCKTKPAPQITVQPTVPEEQAQEVQKKALPNVIKTITPSFKQKLPVASPSAVPVREKHALKNVKKTEENVIHWNFVKKLLNFLFH